MLLFDVFCLYPVTQTISRKMADIGAIRRSMQAKRLITSNPSSAGEHIVISGASVSS
jgi:hypothetical protein